MGRFPGPTPLFCRSLPPLSVSCFSLNVAVPPGSVSSLLPPVFHWRSPGHTLYFWLFSLSFLSFPGFFFGSPPPSAMESSFDSPRATLDGSPAHFRYFVPYLSIAPASKGCVPFRCPKRSPFPFCFSLLDPPIYSESLRSGPRPVLPPANFPPRCARHLVRIASDERVTPRGSRVPPRILTKPYSAPYFGLLYIRPCPLTFLWT